MNPSEAFQFHCDRFNVLAESGCRVTCAAVEHACSTLPICKSNTVNFFAICFWRFLSSSWSSVVSQLRSSFPTRDDANDVLSLSQNSANTLSANCCANAFTSSSGGEKNTETSRCTAAICGKLVADTTGEGDMLDGALPVLLLMGINDATAGNVPGGPAMEN
jgi:hypothetical protein